MYPTPWMSHVCFLNIGDIHLYFSTHNQFGLIFKLTQFSMNFIDSDEKQDGRLTFNAYSQQRYVTNYYIFRSETNFTYKCNVKPVQPIFLVAAVRFSSRKWSK